MENCRSKKLPLLKTKNQFSSFWGMAMHKNVSDAKNLRKMVDKKFKSCQKCTDIEDSCKMKVKDIMQEEFPTEKQWEKLLKSIKDQRKMINFDQSPSIGDQCLNRGDESSLESDIHLDHIRGCVGDVPRSISPRFGQFDQLSAKAFVDHIYMNRSVNKSKPFSDASDILHLKQDLFLKLLQEPDSPVMRHMQNLQFPNRAKDKNRLPSNAESTLKMQKKNMSKSHLWMKLKDRYGFSFKGSSCSGNGNGNEIVVLHPMSRIRNRVDNVSRERQKSNSKSFSLKEIRRKFKEAVGESRRDQHLSLRHDEMRIMEMQRPLSLVKVSHDRPETESKKLNSKKDQVDILSEAKKHLSERLKRGNVGDIVPRKQAMKTLQMILSSPDHSPRTMEQDKEVPSFDSDTQDLKHKGHESVEKTESSEKNHEERCADFRDDPPSACLDSSKGREGHPSPISVLEHEPFSPAETNSPTSTTHEPFSSGSPLQPRHIDFDDHPDTVQDSIIDVSTCIEEGDQDYISAYVRAVIQASEMNFLSPSLGLELYDPFSSLGLFQVGTNHELNLLLDCIHEELVIVHCRRFGFLKPASTRNAGDLKEANVVEQVVKEITSLLFQEQRQVDQIVHRDVAKSGSWLYQLRGRDAEEIAVRIAEDVLQDSVVDTILEFQLILTQQF